MSPEVVRETTVTHPSVHLIELPHWRKLYGLTAGLTIRGGATDDFGLASTLPTAGTFDRWMALPGLVGGVFTKVCTGRQVHGTTILRHHPTDPPGLWAVYDATDGHLTNQDGILLTVTVADCVPVFLHAPDTGDVGLLHAGWRGIAAGILQAGIAAMAENGADVETMVLHLGPSVCGSCYEVGPEVAAELGQSHFDAQCVDLRGILAEIAAKNGLVNVTISEFCTKHDHSFHSYRRDTAESGRMVAFLGRGRG